LFVAAAVRRRSGALSRAIRLVTSAATEWKILVARRFARIIPAAMKLKLKNVFRGFVVVLLAILLWSVWQAEAQTTAMAASATNTVQTAADSALTNAPAAGAAPKRTKAVEPPKWVLDLAGKYPVLRVEFLENELWKYIFSFLYIFLAFYVSKFLDYATRVWLKRLAQKTDTQFDDLLLELLNGPVKIVSFVIFLRIGLEVFDWPPVVDMVMTKGFAIVVAITITYTVLKFLDLMLNFWHRRISNESDKAFNDQLFPIIRKTLKAFVVVVATLVTLSNIGVNITAAIASLSIGGLALGLAAQDTVANLFGAVSILLDKPFRIGDRIQLDAVDGTVESIGLRSTRVRNLDGHLITVPNKTMGNATIVNITRRPNIKTVMNIGVTYDTTPAKLKQALAILNEIYRAHPKTGDLIVSFNKFGDFSLNIMVVHWWSDTDHKAYLVGMQEMNLLIKERFDAEGIGFAFPTQTLYVKQDSEWKLAGKPVPS
jgi:MscS family membrane protein